MTRAIDSIQTVSGLFVRPLDIDPRHINIEDIAAGLSNTCRYAGQMEKFYSVAEHSVHVAQHLRNQGYSARIIMLGLLHDATEAYLCDIPRPIKDYFFIKINDEYKSYREVEDHLMGTILWALGHEQLATEDNWEAVKEADNTLLLSEIIRLKHLHTGIDTKPIEDLYDDDITCCLPKEAQLSFLSCYNTIKAQLD